MKLFSKESAISSVFKFVDCIRNDYQLRMNLEDLISILFRLDEDMIVGYCEYEDWTLVCDEVVYLSGWTNDELADAIDKRWGNIKDIKSPPQMQGMTS
jgi:hypothetical protein